MLPVLGLPQLYTERVFIQCKMTKSQIFVKKLGKIVQFLDGFG